MPGNSKPNKRPKNRIEKHRYSLSAGNQPVSGLASLSERRELARRKLDPSYDRARVNLGPLAPTDEVEALASKYRRGEL